MNLPSWARAMTLALAAAGCGSAESSPAPGPDGGEPGPDAQELAVADAAPPPACYEPSRPAEVAPSPSTIESCATWNNLHRLSGRVLMAGEAGALRIEFATGVHFAGSVEDQAVAVEFVHLHTASDDCQWRVTETLTGELDSDTCVMQLVYRYQEQAEGPGACGAPCAATGAVPIELVPID